MKKFSLRDLPKYCRKFWLPIVHSNCSDLKICTFNQTEKSKLSAKRIFNGHFGGFECFIYKASNILALKSKKLEIFSQYTQSKQIIFLQFLLFNNNFQFPSISYQPAAAPQLIGYPTLHPPGN